MLAKAATRIKAVKEDIIKYPRIFRGHAARDKHPAFCMIGDRQIAHNLPQLAAEYIKGHAGCIVHIQLCRSQYLCSRC